LEWKREREREREKRQEKRNKREDTREENRQEKRIDRRRKREENSPVSHPLPVYPKGRASLVIHAWADHDMTEARGFPICCDSTVML
jgi:hypothetical protein